jgi:hypothetical protein
VSVNHNRYLGITIQGIRAEGRGRGRSDMCAVDKIQGVHIVDQYQREFTVDKGAA